jgi:hypothetical protein
MQNNTKLVKITLYLGAIYYVIGAVAHFFCLTIFPFYDGNLCAPYHDIVIALAAIVIALFIFATARDPIKNEDNLKVIILGVILAALFNSWIIYRVDFGSLGGPAKKFQTIAETILGLIFIIPLVYYWIKKS